MSKKNRDAIIILIVVIAVAAIARALTIKKLPVGKVSESVFTAPVYTHFSKLDGSGVLNADAETPQVVAVMIDNHPDARPQSGVSEARVVYEAPVEGEFTRYMAVFDASQTVAEVGPVRSARPYYLDWLREYGANTLYMHSGGSPLALGLIKQLKINDANEFYFGKYYRRSTDRVAPHNLYSSSDSWNNLFSDYPAATSAWTGWVFDNNLKPLKNSQNGITINFNKNYIVSWQYSGALGKYRRFVNGAEDLDKNGSPRLADNILVQYVKMTTVDEEGRRNIVTAGQGDARALLGGQMAVSSWKKNLAARTQFFDSVGAEIKLIPGQTWVEVAPAGTNVELMN